MPKTRLVLVDDHTMFRDGLRAVLDHEQDMTVVGEAGDAAEAVRLCAELQPDVVLMDLQLSEGNGIEATRRILADHPAIRIIILSMYHDDVLIAAAIQAGARGYVLKDARAAELVQAVRTVAAGGAAIDPSVASRMLEQYRRLAGEEPALGEQDFSPREVEMLRLLAAGDSNRLIAQKLSLSPQTVKNILYGVYQKLGVTNRTEAVVRALQLGVIRRE